MIEYKYIIIGYLLPFKSIGNKSKKGTNAMRFFNYDKPGKGVDVNAPEKKGFFRFWEMFFEKFTKHLGASFMHAITSLPFLVILFFIAPVNGLTDGITDAAMLVNTDMTLRFLFVSLVYILWGCGPATAAYAYICKCFTLRKPVWIISDGWDTFKSNFKQSMLVAILDIAMILLGFTAFSFYGSMYAKSQSMLFLFARVLIFIMLVTYTWMQFYIYQMMTTLELKFKHVLKNSFIYSISSLPFNIVLSIISTALVVVCFSFFHPIFAFILVLWIVPLLSRLPIEFHGARLLRKAISTFEERADQKDTDTKEIEEDIQQ